MTHLLKSLGATVSGVSLDPEPTSVRPNKDLSTKMKYEEYFNLSNLEEFRNYVRLVKPDTIIHLAAHPIVQEGYSQPYKTFYDNFLGTLNLLEILRADNSHQNLQVLISTTDKVYKDSTGRIPHVEPNQLWGSDPYSASKVCVELLAETYWKSYPEMCNVFTARAGNVLGGGDRGEHRLVPYLIKQAQDKAPIELRMPSAIRPWQHVLDVTSAYLCILENSLRLSNRSYNVAPKVLENFTVLELSQVFLQKFGGNNEIINDKKLYGIETHELNVSSESLERDCGFINKMNVMESIKLTEEWESSVIIGKSASEVTFNQISDYFNAK
jgi:CDP-glucose 4,6-dehydratase